MRYLKIIPLWLWHHKKLVIILIIIILGLLFWLGSTSKPPVAYQLETVKPLDIKTTIAASGIINGENSSNLKFKLSGKLAYHNVQAGDTVKAGEIIAGLDTQDLQIALQQAQNTYRSAQAAAEKAEDDVKDNADDETFAQKATRTAAQVSRDNAYDSVKAAQRAFQDTVIVAPIDGIVTATTGVPGQIVSAADTIAQIIDFSKIYFEAEVDEADIPLIQLGQSAEVTLNAYNDQIFTGTVAEIKPTTKTTTSGATVIIVKIDLSGSNIKPIAGLNGQAEIIQQQKNQVLAIPLESLRNDDTVVKKVNQEYQVVKVSTGLKSDTEVEVTSGLAIDDQVVTNPPAPDQPLPNTNNNFWRRLLPGRR